MLLCFNRENSTVECSDRGSCQCGKCVCHKMASNRKRFYTGTYCECDDYSCPNYNGSLCGGKSFPFWKTLEILQCAEAKLEIFSFNHKQFYNIAFNLCFHTFFFFLFLFLYSLLFLILIFSIIPYSYILHYSLFLYSLLFLIRLFSIIPYSHISI